jgi:hypothetical protein
MSVMHILLFRLEDSQPPQKSRLGKAAGQIDAGFRLSYFQ